jgi:flagellar biosynthesis protein FlhG
MNQRELSSKVVSLRTKRLQNGNVTDNGNQKNQWPNTRVIAITSGKGGVGKTNIVANLGFGLSKMGKKILILDADLGLGNLDILLGVAPKYNLSHVINGLKSIAQVTIDGPGNLKILPASSGIQELTYLTKEQRAKVLRELDRLVDPIDILLIDTAAGISSNVIYFSTAAQEIMVVVSPDPSSMTDAYALMKVLSLRYSERQFKILINLARTMNEAEEVFRQLKVVSDRFLNISMEYIGYIAFDENVTKSVRRQKLVSELYPNSEGSKGFEALAKKICQSPPNSCVKGKSNFFGKYIPENMFE